jgi:hypothetical protein
MFDHPNCCDVPMWLVKIEIGDIAVHQTFECKVCDATVNRTVPHVYVDALEQVRLHHG